MTISSQTFGTAPNGEEAKVWTITNGSGLSLSLTDWGATITSVKQPDRSGQSDEVTLGFPDASGYGIGAGYLGATCGRFANRIAKGRFSLDGREYTLECNDGANHLHGGLVGFNSRIWTAEPYSEGNRTGVVFSTISPDGEEGYPGTLRLKADYALDEDGRLTMEYIGESDAPTIINITNHAYWNLAGVGSGDILGQELKLYASAYLPVDDGAIPLGEKKDVGTGPFDFREPKPIGRDIDQVPGGYDHCMVIEGKRGELRPAAEALDPVSGRRLTLHTDRPGVQFYSGNFLAGKPHRKRSGFCLEPQDFPDAPNREEFPSTVLRPGELYRHRSVVEFSTD